MRSEVGFWAMAWNAGPGLMAKNKLEHGVGVGGRHGVGGGGAWRRAGVGPDSRMVGDNDQRFSRFDMASFVEREEQPRQLWTGRGVGRGPLWVEGGEGGKEGFRRNAGWTGEFARGESAPAQRRAPAAARARDAERLAPAPEATAVLQIFKSDEQLKKEYAVHHRWLPALPGAEQRVCSPRDRSYVAERCPRARAGSRLGVTLTVT